MKERFAKVSLLLLVHARHIIRKHTIQIDFSDYIYIFYYNVVCIEK